MTTVAVVGLQWGDEGKGKVVDRMAAEADVVARFHGGHNAGHTICAEKGRIILHIVPSGVLHPHTQCYIGPGVVLSPGHLFEETAMLESNGVSWRGRLFVSPRCSLLLECHRRIDTAREAHARRAIGTTGRGIGPAYEDRAARRGLVVGDLEHPDAMRERLSGLFEYHNFLLKNYYKSETADADKAADELLDRRADLLEMSADFVQRLEERRKAGAAVLLEGAQGAMLDTVFGSYPYVTSSHTVGSYAAVGLGIPPRSIDRTVGVIKAYATRVGNGGFPTELDENDPAHVHLSGRGREVGATTGRPRRCGWLDLAEVKRMADLSGVDALCITKLDVLDGLSTIRCRKSGSGGKLEYADLPGWEGSVHGVCDYDKLPGAARAYIEMIEDYMQIPAVFVSTGEARNDGIMRADWFGD